MGHPENDSPETNDMRFAEFHRAFAHALMTGDEVGAELAIREAMDAKASTADIDELIIAPALWLSATCGSGARSRSPTSTSPPRSRSGCSRSSAKRSGSRSRAAAGA